MKTLQEPPMPTTFWSHAVLQLALLVTYLLVVVPLGNYFPSVQERLGSLEAATGWGLPFLLWIVYIVLLVETITRMTQRWAAQIFTFRRAAFLLTSICLAVPLLFLAFVGLECVLFFIALGHYPVFFGNLYFEQGFWATVVYDLPLMLLMLAGECLRHWMYRGWIAKWHVEYGLRRRPAHEQYLEEA
jgi:hypothetical protein